MNDLFFDLNPSEDEQIMVDTIGKFIQAECTDYHRFEDDPSYFAQILTKCREFGLEELVNENENGANLLGSVLSSLIIQQLSKADMSLAVSVFNRLNYINLVSSQQALASEISALITQQGSVYMPKSAQNCLEISAGTISGTISAVVNGLNCDKLILLAVKNRQTIPVMIDLAANAQNVTGQVKEYMGLKGVQFASLTFDKMPVAYEFENFNLKDYLAKCQIASASMCVGTAKQACSYVIDYCNDRTAFGEPITNRQAVAFMIANIAIETDGMELLVLKAAGRAEDNMEFQGAARKAWLQAAKYSMQIGTDAVQLLGGHGFVKEHPVEKWYRDLRSIAILPTLIAI